MKSNLLLSLVLLALLLPACEKDPVVPPSNLKDLVVPTDFSWSNSQVNNLTINLINPENLVTEGRVIQLMDKEGRLVEQSVVKSGKARFNAQVPTSPESLQLFFPMTRSRLEIPNTGGIRNISFSISSEPEPRSLKSLNGSPSCDEGCDQVFSGNLTNLEIKSEGTYCLTGTLNGGLTISKDATLRICGTANISWTSISNNKTVKIIVTSTGTLTSGSFYLDGSKHTIENYGTVTLTNWFTVKTSVDNYGTMAVNGLDIGKEGTLTNYHKFTCNADVNLSGTLDNEETFTITGSTHSLNMEDNGILVNACQLIIPKNLNSKGVITNNGYLRVGGFFYGESKSTLNLGNQAMLHCTNFQPNCKIYCTDPNGFGSIKVDAITNLDSKTSFTGNIDLCDANGIDNNWGATLGSNVTYCTVYIPVDGCNPEGIGTPSVQDSDNDGIVDDEDQFPNDPTLAFKLNEPYAGYKIWAFEDLWPSTGDYDFNDLVLATRITYFLGPDMRPVSAEVEVVVKALGAGLSNGVGLQFLGQNVPSNNFISSVEGSSAAIDPATGKTLIVSNDIKSALKPFYNNNGTGPKGTPQSFSFTLTFNGSAVTGSTSLFGDFFLYRTSDRSHEIHVPDMPATSAASLAFFGTFDDDTNPSAGYWYKTSNGITWGMTLITVDTDWNNPVEKTSILQAFPEFRDWAISGGNQNKDWYNNGVYDKCFHF